MAEKIISPGVFTRENDLSFVQQGVAQIGAAIVGPTVKGPALIPTQVFSYSEYQALYGESFKSGSNYYQFLTSICAKEYLKHGGPATIVRVLPTDAANATASTHLLRTSGAGAIQSGSITGSKPLGDGQAQHFAYTASNGTAYMFVPVDAPIPHDNTATTTGGSSTGIYYFAKGTVALDISANFIAGNTTSGTTPAGITGDTFTSQSSTGGVNSVIQFSSSAATANQITFKSGSAAGVAGSVATAYSNGFASIGALAAKAGVGASGSTYASFTKAFDIACHTDGHIMNSRPGPSDTLLEVASNDVFVSTSVAGTGTKFGTDSNVRWEINNVQESKGTFTLVVRRGDDSSKRKVILETWNNLSLDPNERNYICASIGSQRPTIGDSTTAYPYLQPAGSFKNRSQFIYIPETSVTNTVDYLTENGDIRDTNATASLPANDSSGSFYGGSDGTNVIPNTTAGAANYYENSTAGNFQGLDIASSTDTGYIGYNCAFNLLANQDEYDINLLIAPGLTDAMSSGLTNNMVTVCENRGDMMTIIDPRDYAASEALASVTAVAEGYDSSYAAMYWPWVQISDPATGKYIWVPQSVIMPSIYAFNDKVSAEWFAPAGLNRGGQETVVQAARKLTHANRDVLYEGNINPVATFPGEGVVVWGQKTLQKKASALDRVNVRRLLINLKKFIASVSKYLIFENNTAQTRNRFLSQVNPYMESVQQRQGLYAFKVVMDETNNTPDIIDRNQMKGDIFIQPAKAAEFIVIDFNIMPTGATFND
tara:strand:+ start:5491 stop:7794 length:2304 start_codon:yes stop_codon:yes gene_type:complete